MPVDQRIRQLTVHAGSGELSIVRRLLKSTPKLAHDWRPIHEAARHGHPKIVAALIRSGADVDARGGAERFRPLHRAIKRPASIKRTKGHLEATRVLLDNGADPLAPGAWYGTNALATAAIVGDREFIDLLLPSYREMDIFTARVMARPKRVRNLLSKHPDLANAVSEHNDMRPLHFCAASGLGSDDLTAATRLKEAAEALIEAGADLDAIGHLAHEFHPLSWAALKKNRSVGDTLIDAGADPDFGILYAAAIRDGSRVQHLIAIGGNINAKNEKGDTLLHIEVSFGTNEGVQFHLEQGADPNVQNERNGSTALHLASGGNSIKLVQLLLDHGAHVHIEDQSGRTPIEIAEARGRDTVSALLKGLPSA